MICDTVYVFPGCCFLLEEGHQSMIDRFQFANRSILWDHGWEWLNWFGNQLCKHKLKGFDGISRKKNTKKRKKENIVKKL